MIAQQSLSDPDRVSLMRAVMAETARFPELGNIACESAPKANPTLRSRKPLIY